MRVASSRVALLGLVSLFLLPLVIAWLMYVGVIDFRPAKTVNRGELVQPPVEVLWPEPIVKLDIETGWVLLHALPENCGELCSRDIEGLARIRRALGRDAERVRTVHLSPVPVDPDGISEIEPGAFRLWDGSGKLPAQLQDISGNGIYLIDPLGKIMLYYRPGSDPNDIKHDLERLLMYGKTDPQP